MYNGKKNIARNVLKMQKNKRANFVKKDVIHGVSWHDDVLNMLHTVSCKQARLSDAL